MNLSASSVQIINKDIEDLLILLIHMMHFKIGY